MGTQAKTATFRSAVHDEIENPTNFWGKTFGLTVQVSVFVAIGAFTYETVPNLDAGERDFLRATEVVLVGLFTLEYVFRLWAAPSRLGFVFSFFGIVDLLAILPFYLALGVDLRALRAFRFLSLFRLFKLVRYTRAISRIHVALSLAKEELALFLTLSLIVLFLAAVGIYYFEHEAQPAAFASVPHSLWWAVATLTTVGYGDIYPVTAGGKMFTFVMLFVGLGLVSVPAGIIASAISKARELQKSPSEEGDPLEDQGSSGRGRAEM